MMYHVLNLQNNDCLYITNDYNKACEWADYYTKELNLHVIIQMRG